MVMSNRDTGTCVVKQIIGWERWQMKDMCPMRRTAQKRPLQSDRRVTQLKTWFRVKQMNLNPNLHQQNTLLSYITDKCGVCLLN